MLSSWITKADLSSVVPLCIIIPVTRYNLLTLSKPNSFSCNVKTTSRLTIDFSGMLPGDITNYHLPHLTCLRLSVIRFLLWPVLFYAFLFFIYLKFYSFFYKISRDNLYIFYNYRYVFLYNIYNYKNRQCFARTVSPNLSRTIAILVNNAFKTVQQSAKDKEDICRRADARQRYLTQDFTLWWAGLRCIILEDCYKTIFKCIHLYNICNCFSVLYFLRPLHITEKENFTEIFH